jgi:hypothetical protein
LPVQTDPVGQSTVTVEFWKEHEHCDPLASRPVPFDVIVQVIVESQGAPPPDQNTKQSRSRFAQVFAEP